MCEEENDQLWRETYDHHAWTKTWIHQSFMTLLLTLFWWINHIFACYFKNLTMIITFSCNRPSKWDKVIGTIQIWLEYKCFWINCNLPFNFLHTLHQKKTIFYYMEIEKFTKQNFFFPSSLYSSSPFFPFLVQKQNKI
jgi:hypothetical protein